MDQQIKLDKFDRAILRDAAVERYLAARPQPPEAMFDHLYAELPRALAEQRGAAVAGAGGDDV